MGILIILHRIAFHLFVSSFFHQCFQTHILEVYSIKQRNKKESRPQEVRPVRRSVGLLLELLSKLEKTPVLQRSHPNRLGEQSAGWTEGPRWPRHPGATNSVHEHMRRHVARPR